METPEDKIQARTAVLGHGSSDAAHRLPAIAILRRIVRRALNFKQRRAG
jgi:hypothetical protein